MGVFKKISNLISSKGFIPIDEFTEICMFDEENGYYSKNMPIGKKGDFITAPEVSQLFGEIIAVYFVNQIQNFLKNEKHIQLIELGGGTGTLTLDILNCCKKFPGIYEKIKCTIVDINSSLIKIQKEKLKEHAAKVSWAKGIDEVEKGTSIIYANEFFDVLPIKQFLYKEDVWLERVIKLNKEQNLFFDTENTPASRKIDITDNLKEGFILERCEGSVAIMHHICNRLKQNKGLFITFDYGYLTNSFSDTLQSLKKHEYNNILSDLGNADITAYVDFGSLIDSIREFGFERFYFMTQKDFLETMGIRERARILSKNNSDANIEGGLQRLTSKNQMGEIFKCLILENLE